MRSLSASSTPQSASSRHCSGAGTPPRPPPGSPPPAAHHAASATPPPSCAAHSNADSGPTVPTPGYSVPCSLRVLLRTRLSQIRVQRNRIPSTDRYRQNLAPPAVIAAHPTGCARPCRARAISCIPSGQCRTGACAHLFITRRHGDTGMRSRRLSGSPLVMAWIPILLWVIDAITLGALRGSVCVHPYITRRHKDTARAV